MDSSNSCSTTDGASPRVLSHGSVGHVAQCGCGHLHLTLQYLTLRFEPEAFRELAALLAFAQRQLDREALARDGATAPELSRPVH